MTMSRNRSQPHRAREGTYVKRALVLLNPRSRRGATGGRAVSECLRGHGIDVRVVTPTRDTFARAIEEHADRVDMIVVAGGDGTLHLAVDELVASGLPLGVVPLGTANDLASTLGIPLAVDQACEVIARGHQTRIDVGWVNGTCFLNAANIGFAVELTRRLSTRSKALWGAAGYGVAALGALRARRAFEAEVVCNGRHERLRSIHITVGNGRYHGGGLVVASDASIDDHLLHLYSVRPLSSWRLLTLVPALRRGRQEQAPDIDTAAAPEIEIRTRRRMRIIADGEPVAHTPARFRLLPQALSVFTPEP